MLSGDSIVSDLVAKSVDLLGEEQIIKLVLTHIHLAKLSHGLLEGRVSDQVLFDLRVSLEGLIHAVALALVEGLGDLSGLVHVRLEARG